MDDGHALMVREDDSVHCMPHSPVGVVDDKRSIVSLDDANQQFFDGACRETASNVNSLYFLRLPAHLPSCPFMMRADFPEFHGPFPASTPQARESSSLATGLKMLLGHRKS